MTNKDVLKQYCDTGVQIPEYQFSKLNKSLMNTYLRKRIISARIAGMANEDSNIILEEYIKLSKEQIEEVLPFIDMYNIIEYLTLEHADELINLIIYKEYDAQILDWLYSDETIELLLNNCEEKNKIEYAKRCYYKSCNIFNIL